MEKKTIVLTGGGSAGHVTPNMAIIRELDIKMWDIHYIGSHSGIEKELIEKIDVPYHGISSGKLRRYMSMKNAGDIFRVMKGCLEARKTLKKIRPSLVFSKGGFVSVPVIVAASTLKIPTLIHESDITPGLANKISQRFASKIFTSFEEATHYFPAHKAQHIGSPIRREILTGSLEKGLRFLDFNKRKPVLTIMGGSLGAKRINEVVRNSLNDLIKDFQIVHLCGKGQVDSSLQQIPQYRQFEYVHDELADILAATDFVITRGGSNAIFEFLSLKIPMLIIPLSLQQSRGDQILNAKSFVKSGYANMLEEENLTEESLLLQLNELQNKRTEMKKNMNTTIKNDALTILLNEIRLWSRGE